MAKNERSLNLFRQGIAAEVKLFFLLVISLVLIVVDSNWNVLEPARKVVSVALYPFQRVALWPRDAVSSIYDWSHALSQANQQIQQAEQQQIEMSRLSVRASQLETENDQLRSLLKVKETVDIPSVAVEILYTPPNPTQQTIVLNKGSDQGIQPGMPVIGVGGIVGQVVRVTPHTAETSLMTNARMSVPALVQRNNLRLIVFGSGHPNQVEARYLAMDPDIKVGDRIISSGIGGYYPAGLAIGTVTAIENHSEQGFARAVIEPSAHPNRSRHFLVLLNAPNDLSELKEEENASDEVAP